MIWFTSDYHLMHKNVIEYCNRPFSSVYSMETEIITRHNSVVSDGDTVYDLGDFCFGDISAATEYLGLLKGKRYILGNYWHHDKYWLSCTLSGLLGLKDNREAQVIDALHVLSFPELGYKYPRKITLCHYPMVSWEASHYGEWHLFGHCHGKYQHPGKAFDVGVDCNDFYPVSLDEVVERLS